MGTFGALLRTLLEREDLSERAFAAKVKISKSTVSGVVLGSRTPPLEHLDTWCDLLGVRGQERQLFHDLAAIAHLPEPVRERFLRLYEDYRRIKLDYAELQGQLRRVGEV